MTSFPLRIKTFPARVVAIVALLSLVAACNRLEGTDTERVEAARTQIEKGDLQAAVVELKTALQINARNTEARLMLADAYLRRNQGIEAEVELKRALEAGVSPRELLVPLARALLAQGDYSRLLSETKPEAAVDLTDVARLHAVRGEAQIALGQNANAAKSFEAALEARPGLLEAILGQAQLSVGSNDLVGGAAQVEQVLKEDPGNVRALLLKADIERYQGRGDDALATYAKVLAASPTNVLALTNAAYIDIVAGRAEEARKYLEVLRKYRGTVASADYLQALIDYKKGDYTAARASAQKALSAAPTHLPTVLLAGTIEYAIGSYGQAERMLQQVVTAAPATLFAREMLAASQLKLHRPQQAIDVLKPVLDAGVNEPRLLTLGGDAYMQNRQYGKASELFSRAAAIDPANTGSKLRLGVSRLASGDVNRALNDLQAVVDLDPTEARADFVLILSRLRRGEYKEAMMAVRGLEQRQPDNPLTFNLKGGVLLASNNGSDARAAFEKSLALDPTFVPAAMNLARLDLQDGHRDAAKARLQAVLDKNPNHVEALIGMADLVDALGEPKAAMLGYLERARASDPKAVEPRLRLVTALLASDPRQAAEIAREATAIEPDNPAGLDALGLAQIATGEQSGALITFGKLAQAYPRSWTAQMRLARLYIDSKNWVGAARTLRAALQIKPDDLEAQALLVGAETRANRPVEALKVAQAVEKQLPGRADGYSLEGDVLMSQAKFALAAGAYEKAFGFSRNNALAIKLHAAYSAAGKEPEANAVMTRWLKDMPKDIDTRAYYANHALRMRQFKAAAEQYQIILEQRPGTVLALNDLAWLYGQLHDPRALPTAEQAYRIRPDEPHVVDTLGTLLLDNGQLQRGIEVLKKGADASPGAVALRFHLAQALFKAGDLANARQQFEFVASSKGEGRLRDAATAALADMEK